MAGHPEGPRPYFNDHEPFACDWLSNLWPGAPVDRRSIEDLRGDDLSGHGRVHLFAGIGGWEYALQLAGWPDALPVWTGSCPCQPFSAAGKQKAEADERHLWPEFRRLIAECRPPVVFGEQVASRLGREWLAGVRADLEALGYAVGAADLCAAGVGAPHIRQRLYWVASRGMGDADSTGCAARDVLSGASSSRPECAVQSGFQGGLGDTDHTGLSQRIGHGRVQREAVWPYQGQASECGGHAGWGNTWLPCLDGKARRVEPGIFPLAYGVPGRMGRLRAYGNAINPHITATFVSAFMAAVGIEPLDLAA
jgi:DNA (cytosine-5)-methyltransferase 1